jgi:hypothetical protein
MQKGLVYMHKGIPRRGLELPLICCNHKEEL